MSLNELLYEYYARQIGWLLFLLFALPLLTFVAGWYCGERWDLPTIHVEVTP